MRMLDSFHSLQESSFIERDIEEEVRRIVGQDHC